MSLLLQWHPVFSQSMNIVWLGDNDQGHVVSPAAVSTTIFIEIWSFCNPTVQHTPLIWYGDVYNRMPASVNSRFLVSATLGSLTDGR